MNGKHARVFKVSVGESMPPGASSFCRLVDHPLPRGKMTKESVSIGTRYRFAPGTRCVPVLYQQRSVGNPTEKVEQCLDSVDGFNQNTDLQKAISTG